MLPGAAMGVSRLNWVNEGQDKVMATEWGRRRILTHLSVFPEGGPWSDARAAWRTWKSLVKMWNAIWSAFALSPGAIPRILVVLLGPSVIPPSS